LNKRKLVRLFEFFRFYYELYDFQKKVEFEKPILKIQLKLNLSNIKNNFYSFVFELFHKLFDIKFSDFQFVHYYFHTFHL
jgi:hypothetical protein